MNYPNLKRQQMPFLDTNLKDNHIMQKTFIGILVIIVATVFFALRNAQYVIVDFWFWQVDSNLSLVIVLSVTFGALSSFLFSLPYQTKNNKEIKEKDEQINILENEIIHLNNKIDNSEVDDRRRIKA